MNTRKSIELTRKLSWITKSINRNSSSMRKVFKTFFMDNWKISVSALFTLCSITIPLSYLHHIKSVYLFQDVVSSLTAWTGAFILLIVILFANLIIPLLVASFYFFIIKSKRKYIKNNNILIKLNNLSSLTPIVAIFFILTSYIFDYSSSQILTIMLMMLFGPSVLCLFYSFKEVGSNCRDLLYIFIFSSMLLFLDISSGEILSLSNIFVALLIISFFYKCMLLIIPKYPLEEKTVQEIIKSKLFKSIFHISLCLILLNFIFIAFYFTMVLSVLPKEMFSFNLSESIRNINQLIYSIILIILYMIASQRHNLFINNNEGKLNYNIYLKETSLLILSAFIILLFVVSFMPKYPIFIISSMRNIGYIEDQRDAQWYSIDNRFIEWNNFHISFLDKKMLYTQEQICSRKYYLDLIQLAKQKKEKTPFHLYGYMAWNTGNIRVFCPVSVSIGKDVGNKCWHIPSQYINLLPK